MWTFWVLNFFSLMTLSLNFFPRNLHSGWMSKPSITISAPTNFKYKKSDQCGIQFCRNVLMTLICLMKKKKTYHHLMITARFFWINFQWRHPIWVSTTTEFPNNWNLSHRPKTTLLQIETKNLFIFLLWAKSNIILGIFFLFSLCSSRSN